MASVSMIRIDGHYRLRSWQPKRYAIAYEIGIRDEVPMVRLKLSCGIPSWCHDDWHPFNDVEPA